jgi:hypothetical protein
VNAPTGHPAWCGREHAAGWPSHTADVGTVTVDGGLALDVSLYQQADKPAAVWLCSHAGTHTDVIDLTPERARGLYDLLGAALTLLEVEL